METPARVLDNIDKFDDLSPPEAQTDVVDSTSPAHAAEHISAQHALAQDCAALRLIEEGIEECRMHIARAHAQMGLLERQRDAVQRRVFIHRARLSPVRAVPDQVLQEIFQYCLPDGAYLVPDACSAPLVLTHVCRRWRAVAQGTSELWSSVALHDRGLWNYDLDVQMMKQWLGRSRMRPIRMSIACRPHADSGPYGNVLCSDIFQLAIAHRAHVRELRLDVDERYLRHFVDHANFPALQSIVISLHPVHRTADELLEPNTPLSFSAPNLRHVTFAGDGASIGLVPRTVLPRITRLSLDSNTTFDLALLLHDCPSLEHLTLTLTFSRGPLAFQLPPEGDRRIVARSLLYFDVRLDEDTLKFGSPETLEGVLDRLELPALRVLSIAAPLPAYYDARTGRTEASWGDHAAWARSPSVSSLLSRSRHARPRFECRDLGCRRQTEAWVLG